MNIGQANDNLVKIVEQEAMWTVDADKPVLYKLYNATETIKQQCCAYGLPSDGYIDLYHRRLEQLNMLHLKR